MGGRGMYDLCDCLFGFSGASAAYGGAAASRGIFGLGLDLKRGLERGGVG